MTHPNVEYFRARVQVCKTNNEAAMEGLVQMILQGNPNPAIPAAHARMAATESLLDTLLARIEDYEERIMLLS